MRHPIRIAVQLQPQHAEYSDLRRAVLEAEEIGVDIVFNWDHFFPLSGDPDGKHFESWTMLASWAEITDTIQLGPLVTSNSYRNPDLLADMARTVDHISGGRVILGIGAGWFERDYTEYGYDFGTKGSRLADLEEGLARIESRLEALNPGPVRHIPILVGGGGERKTLRYTARHADIWHGFGEPELLAHKNAVLDSWCEREGTDASRIERSTTVRADELDRAGEFLDAGVNIFTMTSNGPGYDLSSLPAWVRWRDQKNQES